jgi:hypothetical protein
MAEETSPTPKAESFLEQAERIRKTVSKAQTLVVRGEEQTAGWPEERPRLTADFAAAAQAWIGALAGARRSVSFRALDRAVEDLRRFGRARSRHPRVRAFRRRLRRLRLRLWRLRLRLWLPRILIGCARLIVILALSTAVSILIAKWDTIRRWILP